MSAAFGGLLLTAFIILFILHFIFAPITWLVVFVPLILLGIFVLIDLLFLGGIALFVHRRDRF